MTQCSVSPVPGTRFKFNNLPGFEEPPQRLNEGIHDNRPGEWSEETGHKDAPEGIENDENWNG